jgi:hypothetical protein
VNAEAAEECREHGRHPLAFDIARRSRELLATAMRIRHGRIMNLFSAALQNTIAMLPPQD